MHDSGGHTSSSDTSSSFTSHTSHTSHSPSGTSNPNDMIYYGNNGANFTNNGTNFNTGTNYDPNAVFYNTGANYSAGASVRRGSSAVGIIFVLAILSTVLVPLLIALISLRII
jgi:hypothetical protein